jgi:hypothetical protein
MKQCPYLLPSDGFVKLKLKRSVVIIILIIVLLVAVGYGISFLWPVYDWDRRVPSPDGHFDLVALRGDRAAFDSFFYNIYVFPHSSCPQDKRQGARVWLTPIWRSKKYLVYSGYNYPNFRWTGERSAEIAFGDIYPSTCFFDPVKYFGKTEDVIVFSALFGKRNRANTFP